MRGCKKIPIYLTEVRRLSAFIETKSAQPKSHPNNVKCHEVVWALKSNKTEFERRHKC